MKTIDIPIKDLKFAEYNPRKWSEKAIKDLTNSIKEFGLVDPIIVNSAIERKNIIIGGHFRCKVAKDLGFKEVPVVYVNIPDIKKEQELNLRLNKNLGDWDYELLANFDDDILEDAGFSSEELDEIFDLEASEDEFDADKEYEKIKEPKTKLGDIYQLGGHRLMCGDATKKDDVERLMDEGLAQCIFTDPPYNVNYKYDWREELHKGKKVKGKITSFKDKWSDKEYEDLIQKTFRNGYEFCKDSAVYYCWHACKTEREVRNGVEKAGWHFSQTLIWLKENLILSPGQDYHRIYEPCYFGWKDGKKRFANRGYTNKWKEVWSLDHDDFLEWLDVVYERRDRLKDYVHATQKPVRLAERAIKKHSERDDIVLDLFGGSGSTLLACEQLNRRCYMMDIDPIYCDVIIKRWEQYTNKKAKKVGNKTKQ